jgi:hypothetical protein
MDADIDDLVGSTESRPRASEAAKRLEDHVLRGQMSKYGGVGTPMEITGLHAGVTVGWLAQAFRMDPKTVKQRLEKCPVLKAHQRGYIYEFRVAVEYLVTPKVDIEDYLKKAKVKELPTRLQSEYWQAMRSRQIWEREAGALWPTEDVLSTFSEVAGMLRSELQLWVDNLERTVAVTPEQREFMNAEVHSLQSRLYEKLIQLPQQRRTLPSSAVDHEDTAATQPAEDFSDVL